MTKEPKSPLLYDAHAVQTMARTLLNLRDTAGIHSATFQKQMRDWTARRRKVVSAKLRTPMEGLIMAHAISQCASSIPVCLEQDDEGSLRVLAAELLAATGGLIAYFETTAGCSRADLGLHYDYSSPTLQQQ